MGVDDLWTGVLALFQHAPFQDISKSQGKTLAVDLSIILNRLLNSDADKLASTCNPTYPCPDLLENVKHFHLNMSQYIKLLYVYDGVATKLKEATRKKRTKDREKSGKEWRELRQRALDDPDCVFTDEELSVATESRMKMRKPTAHDHANVLRWMKEEGIMCIGSLEEADLQLVKLEKDGIVDGIISEDGDEFALGAQNLYCKMRRSKNGMYQFKVLNRQIFFGESNPYSSHLNKFPNLVTDAALLLGNDYCPRINGNGPACVVNGSLPNLPGVSKQEREKMRNNDSMLDKLATLKTEEERDDWLLKYGKNGKEEMPTEISNIYWKARKYMRCAPVLQLCKETGEVSIVPLNNLPDGETDLAEYLEMNWLVRTMEDHELLSQIYNCDILPLERKSIESYIVQSTTSRGTEEAQIFEVLHFDVDPIRIQPTQCLVNWLRARGGEVNLMDSRQLLVEAVIKVQHWNVEEAPPRLQPITGTHKPYFKIKPRVAGNEYDNWNSEIFAVAKKLQPLTDDVIDGHIGELRRDRPSLRKRVDNLFCNGFYIPSSMKCRNVESKSDGSPCFLICCECLSSRTKTIHTVYAIFEDKPNGQYLLEHSSCSCKKGELFCSHSIGFLFVLRVLQHKAHSQAQFRDVYPVNPMIVQNSLMLLELVTMIDRFNTSRAQTKRQKRKYEELCNDSPP